MSCVRSNELLYRALEVKHPPGIGYPKPCVQRTDANLPIRTSPQMSASRVNFNESPSSPKE
jgi:hypothetical protein